MKSKGLRGNSKTFRLDFGYHLVPKCFILGIHRPRALTYTKPFLSKHYQEAKEEEEEEERVNLNYLTQYLAVVKNNMQNYGLVV